MSQTFCITSWLFNLHRASACIPTETTATAGSYYALAEDRKGSHCPYPLLPEWCKRIFDAKVRLAFRFREWGLSHPEMRGSWLEPPLNWVYQRCVGGWVRGHTWGFHCDHCGGYDFFSLRGHYCPSCEKYNERNTQRPSRWARFERCLIQARNRATDRMRTMDTYRSRTAWDYDEVPF